MALDLVKVVVASLAVALHYAIVCTGSSVVVTPPAHQFVPINSTGNVTFTCDVTGAGGSRRTAVWQVLGRQILTEGDSPVTRTFAGLGIVAEVIEEGMTQLSISSQARMSYFSETPPTPNITVVCASFDDSGLPLGEVGTPINVVTFDVPLMPTALRLDPNPGDVGQLIFSWLAPPDTLNGIALTYIPAVTGLLLNQTRDTSTVFDDDPSLECLLREFSVFASNAAGSGPVATINETIPISPNITALDGGFQVIEVALADTIRVVLSFPPAFSCNLRFPVLNYSLAVSMLSRHLLDPQQDGGTLTASLEIPGLERDTTFELFIEVCISITCRQSGVRILRTTDVQAAAIVFFENNVFVTCSFASESSSQGCVILLQLSSSTELLYVARSGRNGSQCNQTENQADAYVNITASDWEANGNVGSGAYLLQPTLVDDEGVYFTLTGCMLPQPPDPITVSTLSGGAIAGIVIAAVVVGAAVLVVAVLLLVYRVRTGHWFKLREKDDDKFTVHFEKELLMGEAKPKKRYKALATFRAGRTSPDYSPEETQAHPEDGATAIVSLDSTHHPPKPGTEEQDAVAATNPNSAFTLDILSDQKKVKLHINKSLINRVLRDRNLNTDRRPRRQNSLSRQHLLPLHCEIRVRVVEEDQS